MNPEEILAELEELSVETINPAASPSLGSKNISTITAKCSDWIRRAIWQGISPFCFDDILTQGIEMPWTIVSGRSSTYVIPCTEPLGNDHSGPKVSEEKTVVSGFDSSLSKFSSKANWLYTAQFSCVDVQPAHIKAVKNMTQERRFMRFITNYSFPTLGNLARPSAMASSLGMMSVITPSLNCW